MSLPILDVAIGLCFIYLLLALICSTVNEFLAGLMKRRAVFMDLGISTLFNGDSLLKGAFLQHPLVLGLSKDGSQLPSYLPSNKFAMAFLDVLTGPGQSRCDMGAIRAGVSTLQNAKLKASLGALFASDTLDAAGAQRLVEEWFNEAMDGVKGWYKKHSQYWVLVLSILITIGLNADTLHVARTLWVDPAIRGQMLEEARARASKPRPEELLPLVEYTNPDDATESKPLNVPQTGLSESEQKLLESVMGWPDAGPDKDSNWWLWGLAKLLGWLITAGAVSLGAPFWFDTLNRFMNVRNAGRSPNEARSKTAEAN